jgi:hypothetical protein
LKQTFEKPQSTTRIRLTGRFLAEGTVGGGGFGNSIARRLFTAGDVLPVNASFVGTHFGTHDIFLHPHHSYPIVIVHGGLTHNEKGIASSLTSVGTEVCPNPSIFIFGFTCWVFRCKITHKFSHICLAHGLWTEFADSPRREALECNKNYGPVLVTHIIDPNFEADQHTWPKSSSTLSVFRWSRSVSPTRHFCVPNPVTTRSASANQTLFNIKVFNYFDAVFPDYDL